MPTDRPITTTSILALVLSGCVAGPRPDNAQGALWQPQQQGTVQSSGGRPCVAAAASDMLPSSNRVPASQLLGGVAVLSPGDRVQVRVLGDEHRITGLYVIQPDATLILPDSPPIATTGLDTHGLRVAVQRVLSETGQIRALDNAVDVRLVESVGASVSVSGAVFEFGAVRAGERSSEDRLGQRDGTVSGDANPRALALFRVAARRAACGRMRTSAISKSCGATSWTVIDASGALDGSQRYRCANREW